jgi:hypothetical protein
VPRRQQELQSRRARSASPGAKKAGSAVVINIDKTKQEMTVLVDGSLAGINWSSRIFNSIRNLYCMEIFGRCGKRVG